jgi:hypothetical protein
MDSADDGYARTGGYTAAEVEHTFLQFLEGHLSQRAFTEWLDRYHVAPGATRDSEVEDEINSAVLALRALEHGTRTRQEVHRELLRARGRLNGLARQ